MSEARNSIEGVATLEESATTVAGVVDTPKLEDIAILEESVATVVGVVGTPK